MNLLADESVDGAIVDRLRADNHAVLYVAEMAPGIDDDTVLQRAMRNGALLLTGDRDFGELVFRLQRAHAGVVLIRLAGLPAARRATPCRACLLTAVTKCVPRSASSRRGEYVFVDP